MRFKTYIRLSAAIIGTLFLSHCVWATPYWTPEQIEDEFVRSGAASLPRQDRPLGQRTRSTLDEIAYFHHYSMLCDFLVGLQYTNPGNNRGGMIEGESGSDHGIIQTDNTQEAIRVWSQYAIWTGDTASYGPNIRLAQGYCNRFPAWREGGGYYAIHNCGWGFEAERKYREAYQDTSWTWYADSCALWMAAHPLNFDPNSTSLNQVDPCAEGLGIGGMYPHALYRQRSDWQNFTLTQARRLRQWFESNPQRFYANESWALCGGTALWGICESLFALYPDSGRTWLNQYGSLLDVWQPTGDWNHSFNTWYCNAHHVCYRITGDSTYWHNAVFITDSLIGLDTDNDGGIPPGRSFPVTNDHSWVSAYMGWMGMERIINASPVRDVSAAGFVTPDPLRPHLAGDTFSVSSRVINLGVVDMTAWVRAAGMNILDSLEVALAAGADTIITFAQRWVLADDETLPPVSPICLEVRAANDENPANDTLTTAFDIRRGCQVFGLILAGNSPDAIAARVEFYHEAYPDSLWTAVGSQANQFYTNGPRKLMAGTNTIRVIPPFRFMPDERTTGFIPTPTPPQIDFHLLNTDIALIDDDAGDSLETYYESSLAELQVRARTWNRIAAGLPDLTGIPVTIWFTGGDSVTSLEQEEQDSLESCIRNGHSVLLAGQNITDNLGPASTFLTTVLHCSSRTPNCGGRRAAGIAGNPITDQLDLYIIGAGGAWNQNSPASVWPLEGSTEILRYALGSDEVCGVSGGYENGHYIFLSFGLEAVSGISGSNTRAEFLARCLDWFPDSLNPVISRTELISSIELAQNYPNPFNPTTIIHFSAPISARSVSVVVYNTLGQEVRRLFVGSGTGHTTVVWNGLTDMGFPAASGMYIYRLKADDVSVSRTLQLLR
ncbi:T9SS C-terminal target domain-containing protein [candidate division KSB1 bacterium]|nr:MAG: T9SS C-terminal target domain-containing protein [candidate division KSB1 bacterium]